MLSLSRLCLLLLLYLLLSVTDVDTAALYPSFSPPSLLLRLGCNFLRKEAASLLHVTSPMLDRWQYTCGCTPCKHMLCVTLPFPLSPALFLAAVHSSSYLPPNPPSLILFIDIDVSALCLHQSLSFSLLLCPPLHSFLMLAVWPSSLFLWPSSDYREYIATSHWQAVCRDATTVVVVVPPFLSELLLPFCSNTRGNCSLKNLILFLL